MSMKTVVAVGKNLRLMSPNARARPVPPSRRRLLEMSLPSNLPAARVPFLKLGRLQNSNQTTEQACTQRTTPPSEVWSLGGVGYVLGLKSPARHVGTEYANVD
jgi:hypothetical protein